MNFKTLKYKKIDNIGLITFNRPEHFNTLNKQMSLELLQLAIKCEEDTNLRCLVFTGEGDQSFCAGGDLYSFKNSGHNLINEVREFIVSLHGAISKFCRIKAPIIASINGVAAGAGLSFASFPSFAIASENATFVSSYTNVGLTPDASSSYFLPKIIGHRRYMELVLTNKILSVDEALNWGLINKIVKPNKLLEETIKIAQSLCKGPTLAYGKIKELSLNSFHSSLESQLEMEARFFTESLKSKDFEIGVDSFTKKEKPDFKGH